MTSLAESDALAGLKVKPKVGKDAWMMRSLILIVALYLLASLAFPLITMLTRSFEIYGFRFQEVSVSFEENGQWVEKGTIQEWVDELSQPVNNCCCTKETSRKRTRSSLWSGATFRASS